MKEIELFNGTVLEFPDNTPDSVIDKTAQKETFRAKKMAEYSNIDPTKGMSGTDKFLSGAGKSIYDLGRGVGQRLGMVSQEDIDESKYFDAPLMKTGAGMTGNVTGRVATALPAAFIPGVNTLAGAAALGGGMGLVEPTATDESVTRNVLTGAAGGAVGNRVAHAFGRVARPVQSALPDETADLAAKAAQRGIPLTVAQKTGSKPLKWIEAAMEDMPFTAGKAAAAKESQRAAFNKAVLKTVGENADTASPQVLNAARTRIGGQFEDLSNNVLVPLGEKFQNQLAIVKAGTNEFSPSTIAAALAKAEKLSKDGFITGTAYQKVRSSLGKASSDAFRSGQSELGQALKAIKKGLDESADEVMDKATKGAWTTARKQYQNLKVLEKAAAPTSADAVSGNVSPAKLAQALMSVDKKGFTYGTRRDEMSDLARIGQAFLKDMPSSGTAQRTFYQSLLTNPWEAGTKLTSGLAGAFPGVPLQKLMMSPAGQKYLSQGLVPNTPAAMRLAEALRSGSTAGGIGLALGNGE